MIARVAPAACDFRARAQIEPCFRKILSASLMMSSSLPGRIVGISSTTVTFAPSRRQTEPSSRPITPPPMTIRCFGTSGILSAPMFDSTRFSSNFRNGSSIGTEPVAMMTFCGDRSDCRAVGRRPRRCSPARSVPRPFAQVILFFLKRNSMPLVFCADDVVLPLQHRGEVEPDAVGGDAVVRGVLPHELVVLGRVEERLGRDAADVDAGAAERLVHLDADGGEAELRGADGGDVAARSAADDHDVGSRRRAR